MAGHGETERKLGVSFWQARLFPLTLCLLRLYENISEEGRGGREDVDGGRRTRRRSVGTVWRRRVDPLPCAVISCCHNDPSQQRPPLLYSVVFVCIFKVLKAADWRIVE